MTTASKINRNNMKGQKFSFQQADGQTLNCTIVDVKETKNYFNFQWVFEGQEYATPQGTHIPKESQNPIERMINHNSRSIFKA